jgi:cytochrome c-type biogenesis protein CcmH
MTTFWFLAAALMAVTMAGLLWPLLRQPSGTAVADRPAPALRDVYRDQLRELDADLRAGTLSPARHAEARDELARRLLDDTGEPGMAPRGHRASALLAAALLALLPSAAILLYLHLGNPVALWGADDMHAADDGQHELSVAQIEGMVNQLATRLRDKPDDPEGWSMLARSYTALQRYDDAAAAYDRAIALAPDVAALRSDYADVLASVNGGSLEGPAMEQIRRALALDPDDPKGLALAASAAAERGETGQAIAYWERLYRLLPPDSQTAARVAANLAAAKGIAKAPVAASISGTLALAPDAGRTPGPDETVFLYARALDGPRMPLAVLRRTVRDLPLRFTLDDSQALTPERKLSGQEQVMVEARISASGNAAPQAGDLVGQAGPVRIGSEDVQVVIGGMQPAAR